MKLKDVFDIVNNCTPISLYLKIGDVWLHRSSLLYINSYQKFKKFYDFKVTELDVDIVNYKNVLIVYAEEN